MSESVQLYMEPEEIKTRYLQAYDRKSQIGILADLNACSKREIEKVLEEQGVELSKHAKTAKAWWTADEDSLLRDLWAKGYGIKEIADVMCRTEKAVANRRHRLHLTKDGQKKEDVMTGEEAAVAEEKIPRGSAPRNDMEGADARKDNEGERAGMEERFLVADAPRNDRAEADARNDRAEADARKDAVAAGVVQEAARLLMEAEPEQSIKTYVLEQLKTAPAAEAKAPADRPVLSAEGMLRLVFRAVSTQLNSYMEDGDDKEPTLVDVLSSVGLLALRYFDEGGKNND